MTNILPCTGACCPRKHECKHYDVHLDKTKIQLKYVCSGNPSVCYLGGYRHFIKHIGQ